MKKEFLKKISFDLFTLATKLNRSLFESILKRPGCVCIAQPRSYWVQCVYTTTLKGPIWPLFSYLNITFTWKKIDLNLSSIYTKKKIDSNKIDLFKTTSRGRLFKSDWRSILPVYTGPKINLSKDQSFLSVKIGSNRKNILKYLFNWNRNYSIVHRRVSRESSVRPNQFALTLAAKYA